MERKYGLFYTKEDLLKYFPQEEVNGYIKALEVYENYDVEKSDLIKAFEKKLELLPYQTAMMARGHDYIYRQRQSEWDNLMIKLIAKNDKLMTPVLRDFFLYNECVAEYGYQQNSGEQLAHMVLDSKRGKAYKKLLSKLIVENCPYGPEFGFAAAKMSGYNISQKECDYLTSLKKRNEVFRKENAERVRNYFYSEEKNSSK